MNVACDNSYIVYNMMHPNYLTLFDFKTIVSTFLIGWYASQSRAPPDGRTGSKRKYQYQFEQGNLLPHLPKFQNIWRRCEYFYKEGIDLKTYAKCTEFGIFLCLIKERSCFKNHHSSEKDVIIFKLLSYFNIIYRFLEVSKTLTKSKSLSLSLAFSLIFL